MHAFAAVHSFAMIHAFEMLHAFAVMHAFTAVHELTGLAGVQGDAPGSRFSAQIETLRATSSTGRYPSLIRMDLFGDTATPRSSTRFLLAAR